MQARRRPQRGAGARTWPRLAVFALLACLAALLAARSHRGAQAPRDRAAATPRQVRDIRGFILDRNHRELAVSYRLHQLYARPAQVRSPAVLAARLAPLLERPADELMEILESGQRQVLLDPWMDDDRLARVQALHHPALFAEAVEQRFYPAHAGAAHVVGILGEDGFGLTGMEGRFDLVLRPGEFSGRELPAMDIEPERILGRRGGNVVITLDLEVERRLEQGLSELMRSRGAEAAWGMVLRPESGEILAMAAQPAFNPNYFWKFGEPRYENRLFTEALPLEMFWLPFYQAALITRAAARQEPWLPLTVAAPGEVGGEVALRRMADRVGVFDRIPCDLPNQDPPRSWQRGLAAAGVGILTGFARLLSGDQVVSPHFLAEVQDRAGDQVFVRRSRPLAGPAMIRTVSPRISATVQRAISSLARPAHPGAPCVFAGSSVLMARTREGYSLFRSYETVLAMGPGDRPGFVLLACLRYDTLAPRTREEGERGNGLGRLGAEVLAYTAAHYRPFAPMTRVALEPDPRNRRLYLLSKRLGSRAHLPLHASGPVIIDSREPEMPSLIGCSLRQALRKVAGHGLEVRVRGSGRVTAQDPPPGARLGGVSRCVLTLEAQL